MQGFMSFWIPLWLRRLLVMSMPSSVVAAAGIDITHALVLSQVVLSLVLPVPLVALVRFTASRDVMGEFRKHRPDGRCNRLCLPPQGDPAAFDRGHSEPVFWRLSPSNSSFRGEANFGE
jgi:hypothetical protein